MSTITIGLSKSSKKFPILCWLIMLVEKTTFSHAYIKIKSDSLDRNLIYQANATGVFFIGEPAFLGHNAVVEEYSIPISEAGRKLLLQWAVDNSGKDYGQMELVGVGLKRLAKLFGFNIANPFRDQDKTYICVELVARALQEIGLSMDKPQEEIGLIEMKEFLDKFAINA